MAKKIPHTVILNGWGDDGEAMALYVDGKLVATAEIDGSSDGPETVLDFLYEFRLTPCAVGITSIDVVSEAPDIVTQGMLWDEKADDVVPFPANIDGDSEWLAQFDWAEYKGVIKHK